MGKKRTEAEWETHEFPYENKGNNSLQHYVLERLKAHEHSITVVKVMKANKNGVSDLLLCVLGRYVAIELKVKDNTPTEHQSKFIQQVIRTKGIAGFAYTWGEAKAIISTAGYEIGDE